MIKKVLIANRGEIAARIIRTCRLMGIQTVAVYSEGDRAALHTQLADQAFYLGPDPAATSYLNSERLIALAKRAGADAIHPGFGFLSENAKFAQAVLDAGLIFIGPSPRIIDLMGRKDQAKALAKEAGVPTLPGYNGEDQSLKNLEKEARVLGAPLLIKASAGGGGKGMAIVSDLADFERLLERAKSEARNSFGDDHVLLERFFPTARHIEVQVLGDQHGKILHLFERECSVQRRHQKIIEETPSPSISPEIRQRICESGVLMAGKVDYFNAGTVEFIYDSETQKHYFLEMNTRLQVEHPVTEMVTGLDLVRLQIEIASGLPLRFDQSDLKQTGHALEVRLYAEDPKEGYRPSAGQVRYFQTSSSGARVESGLKSVDEISPYYDPMIAKLITHGPNRSESIAKMRQALSQVKLWGPPSNLHLLHHWTTGSLLAENQFHTRTVEEKFPRWRPEVALELHAALWWLADLSQWDALGLPAGFRNVPTSSEGSSVARLRFEGEEVTLTYQRLAEGLHQVNGKTYRVLDRRPLASLAQVAPGTLGVQHRVECEGELFQADVLEQPCASALFEREVFVHLQGRVGVSLQLLRRTPLGGAPQKEGDYCAPMPGKITKVLVKPGEKVQKGQRLLTLEAMKMESEITAHEGGTIHQVWVTAGEQVSLGKPLLELKGESK